MSKMFDANVKHYKEKFHSTIDKVSAKSVETFAKSQGINDEALKDGFINNSEEFRNLIYTFSKTLMPGHVSCTTYAAIVAVVASNYGVAYKGYAGFCLPRSNPRYSAELAEFNKRKGTEEHPTFANHVYTEANGQIYEFFNGTTSDIDHIDCVEI